MLIATKSAGIAYGFAISHMSRATTAKETDVESPMDAFAKSRDLRHERPNLSQVTRRKGKGAFVPSDTGQTDLRLEEAFKVDKQTETVALRRIVPLCDTRRRRLSELIRRCPCSNHASVVPSSFVGRNSPVGEESIEAEPGGAQARLCRTPDRSMPCKDVPTIGTRSGSAHACSSSADAVASVRERTA